MSPYVTVKILTALNYIVCGFCGFYNSMSSFEEKQHLHLRFKSARLVYSVFSTRGFITASDQNLLLTVVFREAGSPV